LLGVRAGLSPTQLPSSAIDPPISTGANSGASPRRRPIALGVASEFRRRFFGTESGVDAAAPAASSRASSADGACEVVVDASARQL
jgi:hypothetical protein